jgi:hypothetical protein
MAIDAPPFQGHHKSATVSLIYHFLNNIATSSVWLVENSQIANIVVQFVLSSLHSIDANIDARFADTVQVMLVKKSLSFFIILWSVQGVQNQLHDILYKMSGASYFI